MGRHATGWDKSSSGDSPGKPVFREAERISRLKCIWWRSDAILTEIFSTDFDNGC